MLFSFVSFFLPLFKIFDVEIDNFIVPSKDLIVGPFKGRGQHVCLADRLWYRHTTPLLDEGCNQEDVQCSHHCDQGEEAQLEGGHSKVLEQVRPATHMRL
jgi:hypothetical protein